MTGLRAAAASTLLAIGLAAGRALAGDLSGRVTLAVEGAAIDQLGPFVVYLENLDGHRVPPSPRRAEVRQREVRFEPDFLVVTAGQPVDMPNDDEIFHNVFSVSRPNDFDLGTYPAGQSKTVVFRHPGLVRIYCSIHDSMSGGIYVTPTPWFDVAARDGRYRISGVPAGRYRLVVWNRRLPETRRMVEVGDGGVVRADLAIGSGTP